MGARILIVDDEPEMIDFVKMRLEANDFAVLTASDGQTGLTKAISEQPDLILLDVMMPGQDGFQVLQRLKQDEQTRQIPVVMLTAKGETDAITKAQEFDVADYIIKPFESKDLLRAVQRSLRTR